jgi:Polyketide cyclase / dehydrase and lipid transport
MHRPIHFRDQIAEPLGTSGALALQASSVATRMTMHASPEQVWKRLLFYEQIDRRPPLYLRTLLPVPTRTEGRKSVVGDEAKCVYQSGHLMKRVTVIERGHYYGFDVVDQQLAVGGGVKLRGGDYTLRETAGGTEVTLATRYLGLKRPRWLWQLIEGAVCHLFHRYILRAVRRSLALP